MKAVFLTYAFPPSRYPQSIQIAHLARHLELPIDVYCARDAGERDPSILDEKAVPGLRVRRVAMPAWLRAVDKLSPAVAGRILTMPDPYRSWAYRAAAAIQAGDDLGPGTVLVTFGQPMSDHLAGLRLKRLSARPWVAHFSDPWVDNPYQRRGPISRAVNRRLERRIVEAADRLVFTSEETIDLVMAEYRAADRAKARVLPHAFEPAFYGAGAAPAVRIVVRHIGNFYGDRTPAPLLAALAEIARAQPRLLDDLVVELIGDRLDRFEGMVARHALPDGLVRLLPPVSYRESLDRMASASGLLLVDAPAALSVFLPSKLIEYLGAARPVLGLTPEGAARRVLAAAGEDYADPGDLAAAAAALERFLMRVRSPAPPDAHAREHYAAPAVAARFRGMLQDLCGGA